VRFLTVQPVLGEFEAYASAELSRTSPSADNNSNFQVVANLPLSDNFAARVLVYDGEDAGYIDNNRCRATNPAEDPRDADTALTCLNQQDYNYADTTGLRTNLLWEVSDTTRFKGQFWWQDRQTGGDARYHPFDAYNPTPTDPVYAGNSDVADAGVLNFTFFEEGKFRSGDYALTPKPDEQFIYSLTGEFELPFADVSATVSRYERDYQFKFDSTWQVIALLSDGLEAGLPACTVATDPIDPTCVRADLVYALTDQEQSVEQNAFEIRLNSKDSDSPIKWVAGAFYRKRKSLFHSFVPVVNAQGVTFSPPQPPVLPPPNEIGAGIPGCHPCVFARTDNKDIEEIAVFGEIDWAISDSLNLNVGARWFDVDQTEEGFTNFQFAAFGSNPPDPTTPTGQTPPSYNNLSDSEVPWKVALAWHASDDVTLFGSAAIGYRLGGTNNRGIGNIVIPESFQADELVNYEFGVKTQLGDNRTVLNTSVFFMEWDNLQVAGRDLTGAFGFIGNAGKAEVQGTEVELATTLGDNFYVTAQVTYLAKKELTEDQKSTEVIAAGLAGDEIPRVPEITAGFTAQYSYQLPIQGWDGAIRVEGSFTDDSFTQFRPTSEENRYQDSYSIFNARANFRNDELDLDLGLFIENLFDEDGDVSIGGGAGAQPTTKVTNRPRTIGVRVTKGFGRN